MSKYFKLILLMMAITTLLLGVSATSGAAEPPTPYITSTPVYSSTPRHTATPRYTATPNDPIFYEHDKWEVATGSVYDITTTSATIEGKLILHPATGLHIGRFDIVMALQYWKENDPENKITAGTLDSRTDLTTLTVALSGLNPDTIYRYQAVVSSGTSYYPNGSVRSFRTLPLEATPSWTPTPSPTMTPTSIITQTPGRTATPRMVTLTVSVSPSGCGGTVKACPPGTRVSTTKTFTYPSGTVVTLSASAFGGSLLFLGWGVYPFSPTLTITMNGNKSVTAYYGRTLPTVVPTRTPTPTPGQTTPSPGRLKVQFYNQSTTATTNQIYTDFRLVNTGTGAIALEDVKIRYYYTVDGPQLQTFYCDFASAGTSNVTSAFVTMATAKTGADTYLEVGFGSGAGSLAAGGNATIQGRFAKDNWTNYTQTNDYSFSSSGTSYMDWTKVTGYVSGALAWGAEP